MNDSLHSRAQQLLAQDLVEGIASADRQWLAAHLSECERCAAHASETTNALKMLRGSSIELPRNLASRTQLRVRLRAEELRERAPSRMLLWILAGISWTLGVSTAPFVWRGFAWLGSELHLPRFVSIAGVVLWWAIPALLAVGLVLFERRGRTEFSE